MQLEAHPHVNRARPRRVSLSGVVGELILTAGILVLLFIGWQQWFNDLVVGSQQQQAGAELSEEWFALGAEGESPGQPNTIEGQPEPIASAEEPPVLELTGNGDAFAVLIVPRFGDDFRRAVSPGVGAEVLSARSSGVGHYTGTSAPGELGNFAVAAHRTTYGRSFHDIATLRTGDHIYVETVDGWFRYVYRNSEYVLPTQVEVLAPLPQFGGVTPGERVLTMTSCNPIYSAAERIIAYAVMDAWFPRAGGPPTEILRTADGVRS